MNSRTLLLVFVCVAKPVFSKSMLKHVADKKSRLEGSLRIVDEKSYTLVASAIASVDKEIILSTFSFKHQFQHEFQILQSSEQMDMLKNFAYHLRRCGRLQNSMLLSYDLPTCQTLLSSGIPCILDRAAPRPEDLPGMFLSEGCICRGYATVAVAQHRLAKVPKPDELIHLPLPGIAKPKIW